MRSARTLTALASLTLLFGLAACGSTETNCPNPTKDGGTAPDSGTGPDVGTPDGGSSRKADGETCQADDECLGGLCLTEASLGWGHGYCSQLCAAFGNPVLVPCGAGSTCSALQSSSACLKTCTQAGDCRDSTYDCVQVSKAPDPVQRACAFKACTKAADCAGSCNLDSHLCTATPENCTNGTDDDGDGLVDCEDLDCAADTACVTSIAAACTAAKDVSAGGTFTGKTTDGTSLFAGTCNDTLPVTRTLGNGDREKVYQYSAVSPLRVAFTLEVQKGTSDWYTRTTCDDSTTQQTCGRTTTAAPGLFTVDFKTGDDLFLYVDSYKGDATYTLTVEAQNPAQKCQTAVAAMLGDTAGDFADGSYAFAGSCGGKGSVLVFRYTPAATGTISVMATPEGASLDLSLYARSACADSGTELRCADAEFSGTAESLTGLAVTAGAPVYLFVQSWGGKSGAFSLNISTP